MNAYNLEPEARDLLRNKFYYSVYSIVNCNSFSFIAKKILDNFDIELKKFKQVCPIEMLDKLDNPITLKSKIKKAS